MSNVLIVDDVREMRELIGKILKREGHSFTEAETGAQALQALKDDASLDLVVLDVELNDMNGFRVATAIREIRQDIKICFVTSHSDFSDIRKAKLVGAHTYLVKPIKPAQLLERLQS